MAITITQEEKEFLNNFLRENNLFLKKEGRTYFFCLDYNDPIVDGFEICFGGWCYNLFEVVTSIKFSNHYQEEIQKIKEIYKTRKNQTNDFQKYNL